jgi:DNA replication protein DnaC
VLGVEQQSRQMRTRNVSVRMTGSPALKCLEDYDFKFAVGVPKKQSTSWPSLSLIPRKENVLLLRSSGIGKTHLAPSVNGVKPDGSILSCRFRG